MLSREFIKFARALFYARTQDACTTHEKHAYSAHTTNNHHTIMKKTLLTCLTVCMALTAMQAQAQTELKKSVLHNQLVSAAQLKADSIAMAVKGMPSDQKMSVAMPFNATEGQRTYVGAPAHKSGITLAPADNDGFNMYATVMSDESWPIVSETDPESGQVYTYQVPAYDVYTFDGNELKAIGTDPEFGINSLLVANGGGTIAGSEYLFNYNQTFYGQLAYNIYFAFDLDNIKADGSHIGLVQHGDYYTNIANQVAFDATTGNVYGQFYNDRRNGYVWGIRDIELGFTEPIGAMDGKPLRALAFDHLGRAWAINTDNNLIEIDKTSGVARVVGPTGLNNLSSNIMTGAINPKDGTFYFFGTTNDKEPSGEYGEVIPTSTHMYTIDLKTGKATLVKDMPGNAMLAGAAFRPLVYADAVPAAAQNMEIDFEKANLTGSLAFVAPAVTVGGTTLSTSNLEITLDGEVISTMSATAGQNVKLDVDVKTTGLHVLQVVASNDAGAGEPATIQQWFGVDLPDAVTNVKVVNTDYNHATITWDAPAEGIHHGYVDPARLSYTVINSDGAVEATGLKATKLDVSKEGNLLTTRSYTVIAFSGNDQGRSADSERIYYGQPFKAPVTFEFQSRDEFNLWSACDANEDYTTWTYDFYGMFAECKYNRNNGADDYLFSPPIHLTPTQYYNLTSELASAMGYYQERYAVELATAPHPASIIQILHDETDTEHNGIQEPQFYKFMDPFRVETEGDYYLAYHCLSKENQLGLRLYSVKLEKGASDTAPGRAENVSIQPGEAGKLNATVTFTAPTTDTTGRPVEELTKAELYHDAELAGSVRGIEPGKTYTITDSKFAKSGNNTYFLYCYNDEGKGLPVELHVFVGTDIPGYCENTDINLDANGDVIVSWDAPSVGKNGGYCNPSGMNYSVARQFDLVEVYNGGDTQFMDDSFPFYGEQLEVTYGIFPTNFTGEGPGTATPSIIGGEAYEMPIEITLGTGEPTSYWLIAYDPYSKMSVSAPQMPSFDNNGYCLAWTNGTNEPHKKLVNSGRFAVSQTGTPILVFAVRGTVEGASIELSATTDGVVQHLKPVGRTTAKKGEWKEVAFDLSAYKGKEVLFGFTGMTTAKGTVYADDFRVINGDISKYENIATGIGTVLRDEAAPAARYDLQGRPAAEGANGIIISGGKKSLR